MTPITISESLIAAFSTQLRLDYIVVVPCSGLSPLYDHYEHLSQCIYATREEEGVAIAAGLTAGGASVAAVMQQSGVGNALNAVFTLADPYGFYFPIVVIDRGITDSNPVQRLSSQSTMAVLRALGATTLNWRASTINAELNACVASRTRWIVASVDI